MLGTRSWTLCTMRTRSAARFRRSRRAVLAVSCVALGAACRGTSSALSSVGSSVRGVAHCAGTTSAWRGTKWKHGGGLEGELDLLKKESKTPRASSCICHSFDHFHVFPAWMNHDASWLACKTSPQPQPLVRVRETPTGPRSSPASPLRRAPRERLVGGTSSASEQP